MDDWQLISLGISIFVTGIAAIDCHEVWGLRGGYGKGIWRESSIYLMIAKNNRLHSISASVLSWILFIYSFVND